jgi:TolB-like protein
MQYRADQKRDLRQIANSLGVANVLEGTVRRNGNRVRISNFEKLLIESIAQLSRKRDTPPKCCRSRKTPWMVPAF